MFGMETKFRIFKIKVWHCAIRQEIGQTPKTFWALEAVATHNMDYIY